MFEHVVPDGGSPDVLGRLWNLDRARGSWRKGVLGEWVYGL